MLHRTFEDRTGVIWRVSEISADADNAGEERDRRIQPRLARRSSSKGKLLATRPHAWLYFESKSERRRVSSIPNRWKDLDDEELEDMMAHSRPITSHIKHG